jgi:RimJ/RimL family protein N-acetyltransferase
MPIALKTSRLLLRPLRLDDAIALSDLINNERISRNLARVKHPYTLDDANMWLASRDHADQGLPVFAITLDGRLIGVIGIEEDQIADSAEFGYWLGEPWWGRGYMREAANAVLAHGFEAAGCERCTSGYRHGNEASRRILEGLGFRHTGHARRFSAARKAIMDVATLEITRREWERRPSSAR